MKGEREKREGGREREEGREREREREREGRREGGLINLHVTSSYLYLVLVQRTFSVLEVTEVLACVESAFAEQTLRYVKIKVHSTLPS